MEDISFFFQEVAPNNKEYEEGMLGKMLQINTNGNFPTIHSKGIAFFDVPEYRNQSPKTEEKWTNSFRQKLYSLYQGESWEHSLYDLGTISPGKDVKDTFHAIQQIGKELMRANVIPIIIGGSQDLTKALYHAYEDLEQLINLTTIDSRLDLGDHKGKLQHNGWISHILLHKPCYLFNFSNLATQSHYNSATTTNLLNELYFDNCPLGEIKEDIKKTEPFLRNTDLLSVDLTSIRASDLQNRSYSSPNGLSAHQICRMLRYAGISDKLSSLGIFNYYSEDNPVTDELVAQLIWYFNEGYAHRKGDFPIGSKKSYTQFKVYLEELEEEIVFFKSNKSLRWWMEVPYPSSKTSKFMRHQMIPCSYNTYKEAMQGEIPNLWWKTYQKFV